MASPISSQNTNAQALAQLRDIHLPDPVGWWPLALGWYLLALLIIVTVMTTLIFITRFYANNRAKRQALHLLAEYQQHYQREKNSQFAAARVSELLKRVALVYFPRSSVASLQGEEWIQFLNKTSKGLDFTNIQTELLDTPYQPATAKDLNLLFKMVHTWIKQRRGRCLN